MATTEPPKKKSRSLGDNGLTQLMASSEELEIKEEPRGTPGLRTSFGEPYFSPAFCDWGRNSFEGAAPWTVAPPSEEAMYRAYHSHIHQQFSPHVHLQAPFQHIQPQPQSPSQQQPQTPQPQSQSTQPSQSQAPQPRQAQQSPTPSPSQQSPSQSLPPQPPQLSPESNEPDLKRKREQPEPTIQNPSWCPVYHFHSSREGTADFDELKRKFKDDAQPAVETIKEGLKHLKFPMEQEGMSRIEGWIKGVEVAFEAMQRHLEHLLNSTILPPDVLSDLIILQRKAGIEAQQVELYKSEFHHFQVGMHPNNQPPSYGLLVVAKQPFPKPVKQKIKVCGSDGPHEEPTLVRLLSFSRAKIQPTSVVKAHVIVEDYHEKQVQFTSDTTPMDDHGFASFYALKFDKATKKKVARLQFSMEAKIQTPIGEFKTVHIQSESSAPFIVFTNENQWESSETILLKKDCFLGQNEVSFERLANFLQTHFLRSTRQDPADPDRPLSIHDLNYIARQRFRNQRKITAADFDEFMVWFGKILRRIRHNQAFHSVWEKGLVYGLISRQETEKLLDTKPVGTFLIRFSESTNDKIVISSRLKDRCEHMMIAPHQNESHTRLLEVLQRTNRLKQVIQIGSSFSQGLEDLKVVPKEDAFKDHYTKKNSQGGGKIVGYVYDDGAESE